MCLLKKIHKNANYISEIQTRFIQTWFILATMYSKNESSTLSMWHCTITFCSIFHVTAVRDEFPNKAQIYNICIGRLTFLWRSLGLVISRQCDICENLDLLKKYWVNGNEPKRLINFETVQRDTKKLGRHQKD